MSACSATSTRQGVRLSCDKPPMPMHRVHHDPTWNLVWGGASDSGPRPRRVRASNACTTDNCNLSKGHRGAHGQQLEIEL